MQLTGEYRQGADAAGAIEDGEPFAGTVRRRPQGPIGLRQAINHAFTEARARCTPMSLDDHWHNARAQQAAAPDDPLKSQKGIFQVQVQTQIGRQDKPAGHFFFLAPRGHLPGQSLQHFLLEAEFKKLLLVGLADDFDLIKLPPPEGFQDPLRMPIQRASEKMRKM
jgi:hypothetical protein